MTDATRNALLHFEAVGRRLGLHRLRRIPSVEHAWRRIQRLAAATGETTPCVTLDDGSRIEIDPGDDFNLRWARTWEPGIRSLLRRELRPGMTAYDIGANIGIHAALMAELVGATGRVYAWEPNPAILPILGRNLRRYPQAEIFPHALAERTACLPLRQTLRHPQSSIHNGHSAPDAPVVDVRALDEETPRPRDPDLILMDCEGSEPHVIEGARTFLARCDPLPLIVSELNIPLLRSPGSTPADLVGNLVACGYSEFSWLDHETADATERPTTPEEIAWCQKHDALLTFTARGPATTRRG